MRLMDDDGNSIGCRMIDEKSIGSLSKERMDILRVICRKPAYPAEIARALGMPMQTIYYHIRLLEKAGLLEFVDYEERNGAVAKRYRSKAHSIAVVIDKDGWKESGLHPAKVPEILQPFIRNGFFDGRIIVGSPDPHGKYRARAHEVGMIELTMHLGQFARFEFPLYSLDTRLNDEIRKMNLIVAGGPKVNTFVQEINGRLPIAFDKSNFTLFDRKSGKKYEENVGVIEVIKNPYNRSAKILLVGGLNHHGTRAAIIALVKKRIETNTVVQGFDENGDGVVDSVEIL